MNRGGVHSSTVLIISWRWGRRGQPEGLGMFQNTLSITSDAPRSQLSWTSIPPFIWGQIMKMLSSVNCGVLSVQGNECERIDSSKSYPRGGLWWVVPLLLLFCVFFHSLREFTTPSMLSWNCVCQKMRNTMPTKLKSWNIDRLNTSNNVIYLFCNVIFGEYYVLFLLFSFGMLYCDGQFCDVKWKFMHRLYVFCVVW